MKLSERIRETASTSILDNSPRLLLLDVEVLAWADEAERLERALEAQQVRMFRCLWCLAGFCNQCAGGICHCSKCHPSIASQSGNQPL